MTLDQGRRHEGRLPAIRDQWREPLRAQRDPLSGGTGRKRSDRELHRRWRRQSWLGRFVSMYGWRAYALPVLTVVTIVVGYQTVTRTSVHGAAVEEALQGPPSIGSAGTTIIGAPPRGLTQFDANLPAGVLPDGGPFTESGDATWHVIPGAGTRVGRGTAKVFSYTIEIEDGIDSASFGGDEAFARMVDQTLGNPKGWTHNPQIAFIRVDEGSIASGVTPDFRISLTSPITIRAGCGYEIELEASCYNPAYGPTEQPRVFINEARWVRGAVSFQGDVGSYRQYLINHEVGHAIGYQDHEPCDKNNELAPIMMQQTFGTSNDDAAKFDPDRIEADGKICRFNPWPYPIT